MTNSRTDLTGVFGWFGKYWGMKRALRADMTRLGKLAFRRKERCGFLLPDFHKRRTEIDSHPAADQLWQLYDWLLAPFSLWPVDFVGLSRHLLKSLDGKVQFDQDTLLLLDILGPPPDMETQATVGAFEHFVEAGNYDHLLKQPQKFKESEYAAKQNNDLKKAWQHIKNRWDVEAYRNSRGVIRRRMSQERNFRENWDFEWIDDKAKFNLLFDAMCYRWKLYGMEHDEPLLLKISVNPTPHGTMILIPRHWSLDLARDLHWNKIGRLHRSRVATRQGPKLSLSRIQKVKEAKTVLKHWNSAAKQNFHGDARYEFVLGKMGKAKGTDHSWVKEHLRLARSQAP